MNVLFVAHSAKLSGANKSFISLIESLKDKINITVLVNSKDGELTKLLQQLGVKYIYYKYDWMVAHHRQNIVKSIVRYIIDFKKYWSGRLSSKFIFELSTYDFDFVYTNTGVIDIGANIAKRLDIPHFWHIREFGKEDFGLIPLRTKNYYNKILKEAERIIVISHALKKKYINIVPSEKISVVYNGFDIEKLRRSNEGHAFGENVNILVTGQVCEAKGQKQAIEAVELLIKRGYSISLFIAGDVDENYLAPVLRDHPGHEKWLTILGQVNDIYSLRNTMDIELVCSRSEAFGRVTIESMLHSIPVVGSKTGGTTELIEDKVTGLLYNYNDINHLSKCISELIDDKQLYDKIVLSAYEFATNFTIEQTSEQIWRVFNRCH